MFFYIGGSMRLQQCRIGIMLVALAVCTVASVTDLGAWLQRGDSAAAVLQVPLPAGQERPNSVASDVRAVRSRAGRNRSSLHDTWPGAAVPEGHLQPFGGWRPGIPVEVRDDVPRPREFFERYGSGSGQPLIMRGAARHMRAMGWSDERLLSKYGSAPILDVELGLKETRQGGAAPGFSNLGQFLKAYNHSDVHLVTPIPDAMQHEIELLPCLRCGGFLDFLGQHKLWIARGRTRSVVHKDDADNINCLLDGTKRFALVHPRWQSELEAHPNAPSSIDRFGFVDVRLDPRATGYGAYFGRLDVDAVDLIRFPGWRDVNWHRADLHAGDCLYIPQGWYHQVTAGATRTVNAHLWYWRPRYFHASSCVSDHTLPRRKIRFGDCSWGYLPPPAMQIADEEDMICDETLAAAVVSAVGSGACRSLPRKVAAPVGERYHNGRRVKLTRCTRRARHRRGRQRPRNEV